MVHPQIFSTAKISSYTLLDFNKPNWCHCNYAILNVAVNSFPLIVNIALSNSIPNLISIITYAIFLRHRQVTGKKAAVELNDMADSDSVDSKEEQDVDMSVDNVCYAKIKLPCKRGSGKDAVVKESVMMDEDSVDSKEQAMGTSVDNTCYEKLQSRWSSPDYLRI